MLSPFLYFTTWARTFSEIFNVLYVLSRVRLCNPMDCSRQSPLSIKCFRQEYWSGLPFPPLGDLPDPGIEAASLASPTLAGGFFSIVLPEKPTICNRCGDNKLLLWFLTVKKILLFFVFIYTYGLCSFRKACVNQSSNGEWSFPGNKN